MAKNTTASVIIDGVPLDEILTGDQLNPGEIQNLKKDAALAALGVPPGGGDPAQPFVIPNPQNYVAQLVAGKSFYFNPDQAIRASRENAVNMRRDLAILEPLQARQLAVAQLPWHIEPENLRNKKQLKVAAQIEKIIAEIPDFLRFKLALLEAVFYGRYAVNLHYIWDHSTGTKRMICDDWNPINGDSIDYKQWTNEVAIKTGIPFSSHGKHLAVEPSEIGLTHVLTPWEREAFVIHTHLYQAGDYLHPVEAAYVKGVGLRTFIYWTWWLKHETLGILMNYIDRYGTGITIFYFDSGNPQSEAAVRSLAQSYAHNNIILWPRIAGTDHGASGIERIQPDANGINNLLKVIKEYYNEQISRYIRGQDSTAEGSKGGKAVADLHASTFSKIVNMDAINLEETFNKELLPVLMKYNFPDANFKCRFKIAVERPDPKEFLDAAKVFYDLGGVLDESQLRSTMGFAKPNQEDDVLSKKQAMIEGTLNPKGDQNIRISPTGEKEKPQMLDNDVENSLESNDLDQPDDGLESGGD